MTAPKNTAAEGKADLSLIPFDIICKWMPPAYMEGLIKYYRESWRKGFTTTQMFAGCMRHLVAYMGGEAFDPSAAELGIKKHHLAGSVFCLLCMLDTFENHPELDDRGKDWMPEGWGPEMMAEQIERRLNETIRRSEKLEG